MRLINFKCSKCQYGYTCYAEDRDQARDEVEEAGWHQLGNKGMWLCEPCLEAERSNFGGYRNAK